MHNRILHIAIILSFAVLQSCNRDKRPELFEMNHSMDFTIEAGLNTVETHFFLKGDELSQMIIKLNDRDLAYEDVSAVQAKYAELTTVFEDEPLDFIQYITIHVYDPFDLDYNREVFYLEQVPFNTGNLIRPFPGLQDVKDLIYANSFGIEVRLIFRRPPPKTLQMRMRMDLAAFGE